jgi:hypothetical protein
MQDEIDGSFLLEFFESRVSKVAERLQKEPSIKFSHSRFRSICSSYVSKKESRYVLKLLARRGILRYDCVYVYRAWWLDKARI